MTKLVGSNNSDSFLPAMSSIAREAGALLMHYFHQHLKIGDGDVDWDEFFSGLAEIGFYNRPDTVMVSSVFAEDENAHEVSRYQLATMTDYVAKYKN